MRSPTFQQKAQEIAEHVSAAKLEKEWRDYLRDRLRKSPIPDPIENLDIHINIQNICGRIAEQLSNGTYTPKSGHRITVEKSKGLCRQLVHPHPHDALTLQCLTRTFYADIRRCAPSKNSFFELNQAFSKSLFGDGTRYGNLEAWLKFQKKIFNFLDDYEFIVITDIANYYDNIHYDDLRNVLSSHAQIKASILDLMLFILSAMLWQPDYSPRKLIGLPQIDLDAPRLLAHCMLYNVDSFLLDQKGVEFARFMDDIDVGVRSTSQAKCILKDLDLSLQTRHLRLNSGKTLILDRDAARRHFKIRENILLSKLQSHLQDRKLQSQAKRRIKRSLRAVADYCLREKIFDRGNGEKILKRFYTIATQNNLRLSDRILRDTLARRPGAFPSALQHMMRTGLRLRDIKYVEGLLATNELVDDMSRMLIANNITATKMRCTRPIIRSLRSLIKTIGSETYFSAYGSLWLQSKYSELDELMVTIERTQRYWKSDDLLGRAVGGMAPRFLAKRHKNLEMLIKFDQLIDRSFSQGARTVRDFHRSLAFELDTFRKVRAFVRKANDTQALGITHSKFLMLLSCLASETINSKDKNDLLQCHRLALLDDYYGLLIKDALDN